MFSGSAMADKIMRKSKLVVAWLVVRMKVIFEERVSPSFS